MSYLIVWAGITLLILVHEFGHWIAARKFGLRTPVFSIGFGSPALKLGRYWDTDFQITPWLLGGYVMIPELSDESTVKEYLKQKGENPENTRYIPIWQRTIVACAGVFMNFLTAIVIMFLLFACMGKPNPQVTDVYVNELSPSISIARDAGVQPRDVIVAIDGQPVKLPNDVGKQLSTHKNTPAELTLQRGNQQVKVSVTPDADGHIGIMIGVHQIMKYEKMSVGMAAAGSIQFVANMTAKMVEGLGMMLHIVPPPKDMPPGATDVHGIVGIVQFGANMLQDGIFSFGLFLVVMSVNLAVLNILPIPVLDGGYVVFFAIEAITGKPLNAGVRNLLMLVCFALLICLMFFGLFNDFVHPVK